MSDFIKSMMGSQLVIPVYQRNYSWNPFGETAHFMDDLEGLLADRSRNHFLGILIYTESDLGAMYKEIQIVDGQQRLTTSFIFLLCLKRVAKEKNDAEIEGMIDDYYLYNRHASKEARLRLKPAVSEDDVYAKLVYGSWTDLTKKEKETTVYRNYDYIYGRIEKAAQKYSLAEILDTLGRMDILAFPLSDQDNAQQIFESINSTGAPLTSADMIRNYILMNDTSEVQERNYRMYWQPLEQMMPDSHKLEEFFRYYLASRTYELLNRRDVYEGFKDFWNALEADKETKLREINRFCRYYNAIVNGPAEEPELEAVLKNFRRNETRVPAPFLMGMFSLHDEGKLDLKTLMDLIRLLDTYLMRRSLCGMDSGSLSRYFPQLLRSVLNSWQKTHQNLMEITRVFLVNNNRGKALAMPTDSQLRSCLREVNAYSLMCIRPVLERIEHYEATAEVDTSALNIEHIMPQHPDAWWKQHSGARDEEEYAFYANLIGNLTLCAEYDNTRMGNQDFAFKKSVLSKTLHIRMNTELLKKDTWTVRDILQRCDEMADQIIAIYPYEPGKASIEMTKNDNVIILTAPTVNARALYVNPQCIEILAGTTMKAYGPQEMKSMRSLFRDMTEKGILGETETGRIQFEKNYRFHDLNTAAQFLLHRGGDNTAMWTRENGSPLPEAKPAEKTDATDAKAPAKKQQNHRKNNHSGNKPNKAKPSEQKKNPEHKSSAKKPNQNPPKKKADPHHNQNQSRKNDSSDQKQNYQNHQNHSGSHNQKTQPKQAEQKNQEHSGNSQPKKKKSYRRQTMADKMDIKPQKVTPQVKEAEKSGNGFFSNILARFRH